MRIINENGSAMSQAATLLKYFGLHPGQTLASFINGLMALKPDEKDELSRGAAKELGWTVEGWTVED